MYGEDERRGHGQRYSQEYDFMFYEKSFQGKCQVFGTKMEKNRNNNILMHKNNNNTKEATIPQKKEKSTSTIEVVEANREKRTAKEQQFINFFI